MNIWKKIYDTQLECSDCSHMLNISQVTEATVFAVCFSLIPPPKIIYILVELSYFKFILVYTQVRQVRN